MKKSMLKKIIFITLILFIILSNNRIMAFKTSDYNVGGLFYKTAPTLFNMGNKLFGVLLNIATIVSILTIAIIGVKYMFGSVEQKAEYKTSLIPWLIGAAMVFGITRIVWLASTISWSIW